MVDRFQDAEYDADGHRKRSNNVNWKDKVTVVAHNVVKVYDQEIETHVYIDNNYDPPRKTYASPERATKYFEEQAKLDRKREEERGKEAVWKRQVKWEFDNLELIMSVPGWWNELRSLRQGCINVLIANKDRFNDVGEAPFHLIQKFLEKLSREELSEIEDNSPHLKPDTDWLWEIFLLKDYPTYHETCKMRQGEPRTHGWRRMYGKAKLEFETRKESAMAKIAARYKELEEQKKSKKVVFMDKEPPKPTKRAAVKPYERTATSSTMSKVRNELNRNRVAMKNVAVKPVVIHPARSIGLHDPKPISKSGVVPKKPIPSTTGSSSTSTTLQGGSRTTTHRVSALPSGSKSGVAPKVTPSVSPASHGVSVSKAQREGERQVKPLPRPRPKSPPPFDLFAGTTGSSSKTPNTGVIVSRVPAKKASSPTKSTTGSVTPSNRVPSSPTKSTSHSKIATGSTSSTKAASPVKVTSPHTATSPIVTPAVTPIKTTASVAPSSAGLSVKSGVKRPLNAVPSASRPAKSLFLPSKKPRLSGQ